MKFAPKHFFTKDKLENLYWREGLTLAEISEYLNCVNVKYWFNKFNIPRRRAVPYKGKRPDIEWNENLALLLGIIWGDGYTYARHGKQGHHYLEVNTGQDEELADLSCRLLENIKLHPQKYFVENKRYNAKWKGYWRVRVCSKPFVLWLQSLTPEIIIEHLDNGLAKSFWKGMFLAEGYVWRHRKLSIANTNERLLQWGKTVLQGLGYHPTLFKRIYQKHPTWKPLYRLYLQRREEVSRFLQEFKIEVEQ